MNFVIQKLKLNLNLPLYSFSFASNSIKHKLNDENDKGLQRISSVKNSFPHLHLNISISSFIHSLHTAWSHGNTIEFFLSK